MINISLGSKTLDPQVSYIGFKPLVMTENEKKISFLTNSLLREVMAETGEKQLKKIKKLKKLMKVSMSILATVVTLAPKALAATGMTAAETITPAVVMKWGLTIALISVSAGVAISMTMFTVAGIYRMFRKRKEATEWTTDIVKGLVQVLIAVPTVYVLYFLAQLLFSHLTVLKALF